MSNAIARRICVLLLLVALLFSGLTVLAAPAATAGPAAAQELGNSSTSSPASDSPVPAGAAEVPLELAVQKVDATLRDLVRTGSKQDVEVLVFSTDVPALARVMQKYSFEGLLGPKAEKVDFPVVIYLKLPAYALQEVSRMGTTLAVMREQVLQPDVVESSPEVLGAERTTTVQKLVLSPEEVRARKLGLTANADAARPTADSLPAPTADSDPGMTPTASFSSQIHHAIEANANGYTGTGVKVAEVDLGVDFGHPELRGTWAVFNASLVPPAVLAQKPYLLEYDGWPLALNADGVRAYLSGAGAASPSHGFVETSTVLTNFTVGPDTYIRWNRDSPLSTPGDVLGIPTVGSYGGTGYPAVFFNPAEPVTPVPITVPGGTVLMNIVVSFTCVDIDAALVYDTNGNGVPELGELVTYAPTSTGANPEVFAPVSSPATANQWFVMLLAWDGAPGCTTDLLITFVSIANQDADYRVTGIVTQSGQYHVGKHWDSRFVGRYFIEPGVLVVDSASLGHYDTVYVDLDNNFDFTDETPLTRSNPVASKDIPVDLDGDGAPDAPDGFPDISSGLLVYIANAGSRTGVAATVGNTSVSGPIAQAGDIWAQLPDGNLTVNRDPTIYLNGNPWNVVSVINELVTVTPTSPLLQLRATSKVVAASVVLRGTNIQVLDERPLTVTDPATDTSFTTRNAGLLNLEVWRDRTDPSWYAPRLTRLVEGQDYTVSLVTGDVTLLPRITSNPNPFIQNLAGDVMRVYYNYTGTVSLNDYTATAAGAITMRYPLKVGSIVRADYAYNAWTLDRVTGNLTITVPLSAGDQITADYQYGVTPLPYSDVIAARTGVNNYYWASGDLLMFTGSLYGSHGTNVATMIAGQGVMDMLRPDPPLNAQVIPVSPRFRGMAPNAKIMAIPTGLATSSIIQGWYFGVEGYDGVRGTGDEAQIITNSWGIPDPILSSGFGGMERFGDWITTQYAGGRTIIVKSSGNNGYGYGTMSDEGTPGIVTVGASSSWFYRTQPEFLFDRGPNPSYGDAAGFSALGPTTAGMAGVDIVFTGQFVYGASPLNDFFDATDAWVLTSGTSFSAPLAAGALALIYDAYAQGHGGQFPDTATAKELLLSGADRINNDPFKSGAGFGNALRSTNLAAARSGIRASPYAWYPGDYRGADYPASVHLLAAGESDSRAITLTNEGSTPATVSLAATQFQYQSSVNYTFTPSVSRPFMPAGQNWTIVRRGQLVDWFGRELATYNPTLWDNADLIRVTGSYSYSTFQGAARTIFMEPFDWTDVSPNLRYWGVSTNVTAVDWCDSGGFFVSAGPDTTITMWSTTTGLPIRQFSTAAIADVPYVNDIAVSPNCNLVAVATGAGDFGPGRVAVFNANTGAFLWRRLGDFAGLGLPVSSVEFSPDGTQLAYTSYSNALYRVIFGIPADDSSLLPDILVRNPATGALITTAAGHKDVVNDVGWSADSTQLISSAGDTAWLWDNSVLVFDATTNPATFVAGFSGHADRRTGAPVDGVKGVALHPDGVRAISAGLDDKVQVWDITATPTATVDTFVALGGETTFNLANGNVVPLSYSVLRNGVPVNELQPFAPASGDFRIYGDIGRLQWFGIDTGPLVAGDVLTVLYEYQAPVQTVTQSRPDSVAITPGGTVLVGSFRAGNVVGYSAVPSLAQLFVSVPQWDVNGVVSVGTLASGDFFMGTWGGEVDLRDSAFGALVPMGLDWNNVPFNPYGLTGLLFERNRMGVFTPPQNVFEMRVHDPSTRTHDGLAIWWRHISGPAVNTPVTVEIEFFGRRPWTWISGVSGNPTINPGTPLTLNPTVTAPGTAPVGLYEGQIEVTNGTDVTTIPVVVNVALKGGSVFDVGGVGPRQLYDNTQLRSYGEDGDFRLYFFDNPDSFSLKTGQRWTVDLTMPGRDSYIIPRHAQRAAETAFSGLLFGSLNASRYGPFVVTETDVGAPGFFKKNVDWTGQGNGAFKAMTAGPGVNVLYLQTSVLNGSAGYETYAGRTGLMSVTPFPLSVSTNQLTDDTTMSLTTTTPWEPGPDPFVSSYGKSIGVVTTISEETVTEDLPVDPYCPAGLPRCEGSMTFQEYLFGAPNRVRTDVPAGTMAVRWEMLFHNGARDVDFGLWYDDNCDGAYTIDDDAAGSVGATGANPERIALTFPATGCYWLHAAGFDVDPGSLFDLTFALTVIGVSAVVPTDLPTATIPAGSFTQFNLSWDLPSTTADGVQSYAFFISPGNAPLSLALLVTFSLHIDHEGPTISDPSPASGSTIRNNLPSIVANAFDPADFELDVYSPTLSVDGVDVTQLSQVFSVFADPATDPLTCCYKLLTMVYDPPAPMFDGLHIAEMSARDLAGNTATLSWSWYIDTSAPSLVLSSPEDNMITDGSPVVVSGRTESGARLTVAGVVVTTGADGSFETAVDLVEGRNVIDVTSTDPLGNEARLIRTVVYDPTGPTLSGVRSTEGSETRAASTIIRGGSSEPLAWVTVNGLPAQVFADGSFEKAASLAEGVNTFIIQVADFAGHTASTALTVTRDSTPPAITLTPLSRTYITALNDYNVTIAGSVSGADTVLVTINGVVIGNGPGAFSRTVQLSLGSNVFVIEAQDRLGNRATVTAAVTYAPVVENIQRSYTSVILMAVAVVLLIVGFLVGWMMWGRGGAPPAAEAPEEAPPAEEARAPEPEEMPAEEEMTTEEEEL